MSVDYYQYQISKMVEELTHIRRYFDNSDIEAPTLKIAISALQRAAEEIKESEAYLKEREGTYENKSEELEKEKQEVNE